MPTCRAKIRRPTLNKPGQHGAVRSTLWAEQSGVKMPSFFGYMAYSCLILVPLFLLMTVVFFRM